MKGIRFIAALVLMSSTIPAQSSPTVPKEFFSTYPLDDAAQLLEHLYGKVITYEEPVLVWSGDLLPQTFINPNTALYVPPRPHGFTVPTGSGTDPDLASVLQKIIAANNAQSIGPRFGLLTSTWGYHIVPVQSHDENGSLVPVQSPLDFPVSIPVETRTPLRHMQELIAAITKASGTRVSLGVAGSPRGFDTEFLGRQAILKADSLRWGAKEISGRDALIDLFDKSATTLLWSLRCVSSPQPADRFCAFNMRKLSVFVTDSVGDSHLNVLVFDRLSKLQAR